MGQNMRKCMWTDYSEKGPLYSWKGTIHVPFMSLSMSFTRTGGLLITTCENNIISFLWQGSVHGELYRCRQQIGPATPWTRY